MLGATDEKFVWLRPGIDSQSGKAHNAPAGFVSATRRNFVDSFQPCNSMCSFVMHSVADGVFAVDRNFVITFFNRAAGEIAGIPPAQADRKSVV